MLYIVPVVKYLRHKDGNPRHGGLWNVEHMIGGMMVYRGVGLCYNLRKTKLNLLDG